MCVGGGGGETEDNGTQTEIVAKTSGAGDAGVLPYR